MTSRHLVDPEIAPLLDMLPPLVLSDEIISDVRARFAIPNPDLQPPVIEPVKRSVPGINGAPDVPVLLFDPPGRTTDAAILHIHGGGMVMGTADSSDVANAALALELSVPVVSVDYRLAPDTPFPGPQEDCLAAYEWLIADADTLKIDPSRIAIIGESAGAGLAASLTQMLRDQNRQQARAQLLIYPMLDHRTGGTNAPGLANTGEFIWTREANQYGWRSLQGGYDAADARAGWFSPALAADMSGLPPTFIAVGALDLFLEEDLDYAKRLVSAGVPVEVHVYPGAVHGFQIIATASVSQTYQRDLLAAFSRLLAL